MLDTTARIKKLSIASENKRGNLPLTLENYLLILKRNDISRN